MNHPLVLFVQRLPRRVWYGLALLVLVGTGILIGRALPSTAVTPVVEQGTVTFVNEGLPPVGGPADFAARLDGMSTSQDFTLANFVQWTNSGNDAWQLPGSLPPIPSCMVPSAHSRRGGDGFGSVRAHIKFGVVRVPMPDGELDPVVVWVQCR